MRSPPWGLRIALSVDFASPHSVSEGAVAELNAQQRRAEVQRFRADLAEMNARTREDAMDRVSVLFVFTKAPAIQAVGLSCVIPNTVSVSQRRKLSHRSVQLGVLLAHHLWLEVLIRRELSI